MVVLVTVRLTAGKIPAVTALILKRQGYKCPLCRAALRQTTKKRPALDHDHSTGLIRGVLCFNCNGMEGKVMNRATRAKGEGTAVQWLRNLILYLDMHEEAPGELIHHTFKDEEQKRVARNKKARAVSAKLRAMK